MPPSLNTALLEEPDHWRHARDVDVDLAVGVLVHVLVLRLEVLPHVAGVLILERVVFNSPISDLDMLYRVTIQVVSNLPLTSKHKFCFNMRPVSLKATFVLVSMGGLPQPNVSPCTRCWEFERGLP